MFKMNRKWSFREEYPDRRSSSANILEKEKHQLVEKLEDDHDLWSFF